MIRKSRANHLFTVASTQNGYFTAAQAVLAGYCFNNHPYHVKRGNWLREWRGIYRFPNFPHHPDDQYMFWYLWSCNRKGQPQGVYSFETALTLYDVGDLMPAKLHMTVPKKFQRFREIPPILILHRDDLAVSDYQIIRGFTVTTPQRTTLDIVRENMIEDHLIEQAVAEFTKRGLLTKRNILKLIEYEPKTAQYFFGKK